MSKATKSLLLKAKEYWTSLEKKRKNSLMFMGIFFLIGVSILVILFTHTNYTVMYTGLDVYETGEIYTKLTDLGADVKIKNDTTILISDTQADLYRMTLAKEGYPRSGLSYDVYTKNVSMGISESEKQTYMLFQLQDRLQNTIKTLKGVNGAVVTISKPDDALFVLESQKKPITAAVVIDITSGFSLSTANVKAIEHLVAKSMSGLSNENITIIDTQMNILNRKSDGDIGNASEKYELQSLLELEIEKKVASIIEPVFGYGNVKVAANVKMDYSKVSEQKTNFSGVNDDEGIPYSITEKKENITDTQNATENNNNSTVLGSEAVSSEKTTQYYVNQSTKTLEYEQGTIEGIKLSILINSTGITEDMLSNIQKMAANSIGGNESDIMVQAVEFTSGTVIDDAMSKNLENNISKVLLGNPDFILKAVMLICLFILGLMMIRAFKKGLLGTKKQMSLQNDGISEALLQELGNKKDPEGIFRQEIDKYVDNNPEVVADLLKNWINEE